MDMERYYERKSRAQALMLSDYEWLQTQKGRYEWAVNKSLLVEWVNDVGYHVAPMMKEDGFHQHQGMYDELLQPKKFSRLYQECLEVLGMEALHYPSSALSKLHAREQRQGIKPDTITLFYMNHLDGVEECRIIERLIRLR